MNACTSVIIEKMFLLQYLSKLNKTEPSLRETPQRDSLLPPQPITAGGITVSTDHAQSLPSHTVIALSALSQDTHSSSSTTAAARLTTCAQESVPASSLWPSTRWPSCPSSATSCCFSPGGKWSMLKTDTSPRRWNTWGGSSEGAWWWVDLSPACGRWAWPRGL